MSELRIVIKRVGEEAEITSIANDYKSMQKIVGGLIENVNIGRNNGQIFALVVNDEGLVKKLPFNFAIEGKPIVGDVFITKYSSAGESLPLTVEEAERWRQRLDSLNTKQQSEAAKVAAAPVDDSMQVLVIPITHDENGETIPPEATALALLGSLGREVEVIPPENDKIYDAAIAVLRQQDHQFEIVDPDDYLIKIRGADGEQEKYLRVVRFIDSEQG